MSSNTDNRPATKRIGRTDLLLKREQLASLGRQDMAGYLQEWQHAQAARLRHFSAQLTDDQLALVHETLEPFVAQVSAGDGGNPNREGLALLLLCQTYRELREGRA